MTRFDSRGIARAATIAPWIACEVSSAGMIPSSRAKSWNASSASASVAARYSTR